MNTKVIGIGSWAESIAQKIRWAATTKHPVSSHPETNAQLPIVLNSESTTYLLSLDRDWIVIDCSQRKQQAISVPNWYILVSVIPPFF
jgi:hypothetical protein